MKHRESLHVFESCTSNPFVLCWKNVWDTKNLLICHLGKVQVLLISLMVALEQIVMFVFNFEVIIFVSHEIS